MKFDLADIEQVAVVNQTLYRVKALRWQERSRVHAALKSWEGTPDYKKIISGLNLLGQIPKDQMILTGRITVDRKNRGIYELKALRGNARLLFFYEVIDEVDCLLKFKANEIENEIDL